MDFKLFGKQGYKELVGGVVKSDDDKNTLEYIRHNVNDISYWINSPVTRYFLDCVDMEMEKNKSKLVIADNMEQVRFIQGFIEGIKALNRRVNKINDIAKKIIGG